VLACPRSTSRTLRQRVRQDRSSINKYEIARVVLTRLNEQGDRTLAARREVIKRIVEFEDFTSCWPDDQLKARGLVSELRRVVGVKDSFVRIRQERKQERNERLAAARAEAGKAARRRAQGQDLHRRLTLLFGESDVRRRGIELEKLLNELFALDGILIRDLDDVLAERSLDACQPYPAVRMATALFCYSLVPRAQAKRGATKAELLAAVYQPHNMSFHAAEEVFNAIVSDDEGLGALDITDTASGKGQDRYQLSVAQTLRMFLRQARNAVQPADRDAYIWEQAQTLAQKAKGRFDQLVFVTAPPPNTAAPLSQVFGDVDQNSQTRLVILDPRRWNLNNGRDTATRTEVAAMLGVGERALPVDNGASCVVACVNTQRRDALRRRATDMLAWAEVLRQLDPNDEKRNEALQQKAARDRVDADLLKAYQHLACLVRTDRVEVVWERFDDDAKTSLKGNHTWDALVGNGRAVLPYTLSGDYLRTLLDKMNRPLTLKEVTQQFYKNAAFPIVPSADDIRRL
jgi:hypothetical protein